MAQEQVRVIVEISGGLVSNIVAGDFVDVQVLDWDNLLGAGSTSQDTRDTWNALSEYVQEHVKTNYPDEFAKIHARIQLGDK
jgi:hypothetical protein